MIGTERREVVFYRCHPATNSQGCPEKYVGHPVFGSQRQEKFLGGLNQIDDATHRDRQAGLDRANRAVAEISRKQANVLRQVEDADARDLFGTDCRQRNRRDQAADHGND
ncbi:MAG TPA: hypothetical protein VGN81_10910 [Pseudonocardiaceae bacterium]|jgi:hypothetical protein